MIVDIQEAARRMLADYDARTPCRLFAEPIELTIDEAYALQAEIARLREARGERVVGYKLGCTSPAVQEQLGIGEPIVAPIFDTGCHDSGVRLSHANYANLAVEGELAVRLGADVSDPALSDDAWQGAIESIFPVIELHHYVLRSPRPRCQELIASHGMHAGFAVGEQPHRGPRIQAQNMIMTVNDKEVGRSDDPWTMGGPAAALRWLSTHLAKRGLRLRQGQVILAGSALPLFPVGPGSRVTAEAYPLGSSSATID